MKKFLMSFVLFFATLVLADAAPQWGSPRMGEEVVHEQLHSDVTESVPYKKQKTRETFKSDVLEDLGELEEGDFEDLADEQLQNEEEDLDLLEDLEEEEAENSDGAEAVEEQSKSEEVAGEEEGDVEELGEEELEDDAESDAA